MNERANTSYATSGSIIGGATHTASVLKSEPELFRIQQRLDDCRNRLASIAERSNAIGDGLFGSVPKGLDTGCCEARSGIIGSIDDVIDGINVQISDIEENVRRIAQAVPH